MTNGIFLHILATTLSALMTFHQNVTLSNSSRVDTCFHSHVQDTLDNNHGESAKRWNVSDIKSLENAGAVAPMIFDSHLGWKPIAGCGGIKGEQVPSGKAEESILPAYNAVQKMIEVADI